VNLKELTTKTVIYRIFAIGITFGIVYLFTRNLPMTTGITAGIEILKALGYFSYELMWRKLQNFIAETGGIKETYPRVPLPEKIRAYVALLRPITILVPAIATVMGIIICLGYYNQLHLFWQNLHIVILASIVIALAQGLGMCTNQYTDYRIDQIGKPYRPIPSGKLSRREAIFFAIGLVPFVVIGSFAINSLFGILVLVLLFFSVFYSIEPIRAKRRGWISPLWQATSRGLLSLPVIWAVFGNPFETFVPWAISSLLFVFLIGAANIKDIDDMEADRMNGIITLPVRYGDKLGYYISPFLFAPFVLLPIYTIKSVLPLASICLMALIVLPVVLSNNLIKQKRPKIPWMENDVNWIAMYTMIGLIYVGFAIVFSV